MTHKTCSSRWIPSESHSAWHLRLNTITPRMPGDLHYTPKLWLNTVPARHQVSNITVVIFCWILGDSCNTWHLSLNTVPPRIPGELHYAHKLWLNTVQARRPGELHYTRQLLLKTVRARTPGESLNTWHNRMNTVPARIPGQSQIIFDSFKVEYCSGHCTRWVT